MGKVHSSAAPGTISWYDVHRLPGGTEMSGPAPKATRMTVEAFLAWDDGSGIDYELYRGEPVARHIRFVDGRPVAQAAASAEHAAIVTNIGAALRNRLRPPCRAFSSAGVARRDGADSYYKPDVMVSCVGGRIPGWIVPDPVFIVEVLSRGTAGFDEGLKLKITARCPVSRPFCWSRRGRPRRVSSTGSASAGSWSS